MKRSWLTGLGTGLAIGVAVLAFSRTMQAQGGGSAPTGRLACINVVQVLNDYQRQKDLVDEVGALQEKLSAENKQRRDRIDTLQAELDRMDPADPTLVQRMREMLALQIDYKNWADLKQADVAREFALWSVRIYKEMLQATEAIAKRDGYDLVLYKGEFQAVSMDPDVIKDQIRNLHLLYNNASIDISQVVLDKLNAEYRAQPRVQMLQQ
ncbi:MAG: OmpH family outer membrane protein [Phycisphaerae bacterium]|mgnify:CR=1 FL=1|nr:OmpH family outer membrane protein [Phycisphaerae bacterium]